MSATNTLDTLRTGVPPELLTRPQWVVWRLVPQPGKPKPRKVPFDAKTGRQADPTDPASWSGFDDCARAFEQGGYSGLGFVFAPYDPYCGIDFDDCVSGGEILPWVREQLLELDSYTEYSVSGEGVHVVVKGKLPAGGNRRKVDAGGGRAVGVEMYDGNRFFAMTGNRVPKTPKPIFPRQDALDRLHQAVFGPQAAAGNGGRQKPSTVVGGSANPLLAQRTDQQLIGKLLNHPRKPHFRALWAGDITGYPSRSEAVLALLNDLAWVTGSDRARMDRLFRQSGLMDAKFDEPRNGTTWGWEQIEKAASDTHNWYDPSYDIAQEAARQAANGNGHMNGTGPATAANKAPGNTAPGGSSGPQAQAGTATSNGATNGPQAQPSGKQRQPGMFSRLFTYSQVINWPPKTWLIDRVVGERDLVMVYGEAGSGKTHVILDMCFAAVLGRTWAGKFAVARPLTVVYCAGEGMTGISDRLRAIEDHWGAKLPDTHFFIPPAIPQLFDAGRHDGIDQFVFDWQATNRPQLDLLIFDTTAMAIAGADENSAKDMGIVLDRLRGVIRALGCSVILVHHTGKSGESERGSSALRGAMDTMIWVKGGLKHTIELTKLKDGEPWQPQTFTLIAKGNSVYTFWDGATANGPQPSKAQSVRDAVYSLLLNYPTDRFTINQIAQGIGETPNEVNKALVALHSSRKVERHSAPPGSRHKWEWSLAGGIAAAQP